MANPFKGEGNAKALRLGMQVTATRNKSIRSCPRSSGSGAMIFGENAVKKVALRNPCGAAVMSGATRRTAVAGLFHGNAARCGTQ